MALSPGTRLGPHEILSFLGAGGMGEVYRARDTRLDRTVAIKILPSTDPELKARFEREAKAIAALTHPHICTLYDVGHEHETDYLVMEYLDGQTLAARLQHGPLKLNDVLKHAIEIADALDKAHRVGVIHRDLKPGNIMLTKGGAKLLDFGLAKLRSGQSGGIAGMTAVLTQSAPLTGPGSIVGTLQYMAPEQLEGRDADERSDLFALGTVLYEMVTGRKAFQGSNAASVIAAIMTGEPPVAELKTLSPPGLEHLVKTCLAKNPEERRQTAHDVVLQLEWIAGSHDGPATRSVRAGRPGWRWLAAAVVLFAVSSVVTRYFTTGERVRPAMSVSILPPGDALFEDVPVISPDGSRLAFSARGPSGQTVLWIRQMDTSTSVPISGTATARDPFWSPDSRFVGFFAQGKMKRVSAETGSAALPVQTLADAPDPRGGTWSPDGVIVFARNIEDGLYRVPAAGGEVTPLTTLDRGKRENSHRWPQFLPDGRHILFLARSSVPQHQGIYVGTPGSSDRRLLLRTPLNALVAGVPELALPGRLFSAARGYLLFVRNQTFMAQPFDLDRLELAGEPHPIAESVGTYTNRGMFSVSANASLAYQTVTSEREQLNWFDRDGKFLGTAAASAGHGRLSPDGSRLALGRLDPRSGAGDVWLDDLPRRVSTRLTAHPAYDWIPVWSPDGNRIVFASNREGMMDLYEKAVSGSEPERQILKSDKRKTPTDWSRDGQFILFDLEDPATGWDLAALPMNGDRQPFPILQSEFNETQGVLSPDGKWLAYTSDETGGSQVYVQPFSGRPVSSIEDRSSRKWRISDDGGVQPRWRSDGRELFYLSLDRKIVSVPVKTGLAFEPGMATSLFTSTLQPDSTVSGYDVTPDGKRLIITVSDDRHPAPLTLLLNWTAALNRGR